MLPLSHAHNSPGSCFGDSFGAFLASLSSDGDQGPSFSLRGSPWGLAPSQAHPPARPCGCWEWKGATDPGDASGKTQVPTTARAQCITDLCVASESSSGKVAVSWEGKKEDVGRRGSSAPGPEGGLLFVPPLQGLLCVSPATASTPPPWAQALSSSCLFLTLGPWRGVLLLPRSCLAALEDPDVGEGFL